MTTLQTRITFGSAMLGVFFGILYLGSYFHTDIFIGLLTLFVGSVGLLEFYKMAEGDGISPFKIPGVLCGVLLFVNVWLTARAGEAHSSSLAVAGPLVFLTFIVITVQGFRRELTDVLQNVSVTIFGVLYISFLISYSMALIHLPGGNGVFDFLFVVLVSKVADIGGYLFGRKFGRHKLSPKISPKKSIEGLIFGVALSVILAWLMCAVSDNWIVPWQWIVPFALIVSIAGVFGDLTESMLKRGASVKDSGDYIPTFGGVLDVIDSLLISMPIAYYALVFGKGM